jgi:preprotein translocase subunit YajC
MEVGQEQSSVAVSAPNGEATPEKAPAKGMPTGQLIFIGLMFVVMYFLVIKGPRKQQKEQAKMRSSLQKNDRIVTIGGIYGTVLDVNDKEVTVKIDESNNTKMKIRIDAVASKIEK